jgi:nitroreductase
MSLTDVTPRTADTATPLLPTLAERWSPRAFDPSAVVDETTLTAALEAARWSPSANNSQPWRFIVARRGTPEFESITENLLGFNQVWAGAASVLIVAIAEVSDADGIERRWATYDLGQAVAHLSIQAHHDGLYAHQMGGFRPDGMREAFGLDQRFVPVSVTALGALGQADALPDQLRERENAPRTRLPLEDVVIVRA